MVHHFNAYASHATEAATSSAQAHHHQEYRFSVSAQQAPGLATTSHANSASTGSRPQGPRIQLWRCRCVWHMRRDTTRTRSRFFPRSTAPDTPPPRGRPKASQHRRNLYRPDMPTTRGRGADTFLVSAGAGRPPSPLRYRLGGLPACWLMISDRVSPTQSQPPRSLARSNKWAPYCLHIQDKARSRSVSLYVVPAGCGSM